MEELSNTCDSLDHSHHKIITGPKKSKYLWISMADFFFLIFLYAYHNNKNRLNTILIYSKNNTWCTWMFYVNIVMFSAVIQYLKVHLPTSFYRL